MYSENNSDEEEAVPDDTSQETPEVPKPLVRLRVKLCLRKWGSEIWHKYG